MGAMGGEKAAGASTTNMFAFAMRATRATNGQQSALGGSTLWPHSVSNAGRDGGGKGKARSFHSTHVECNKQQ